MEVKLAEVTAACLARSNLGLPDEEPMILRTIMMNVVSGKVNMSFRTIVNFIFAEYLEDDNSDLFHKEAEKWKAVLLNLTFEEAKDQFITVRRVSEGWTVE